MNLYKVTIERLKGKSKTAYGYCSTAFYASESAAETLERYQGIFPASAGYRLSVGRARLSDLTSDLRDEGFLKVEEVPA